MARVPLDETEKFTFDWLTVVDEVSDFHGDGEGCARVVGGDNAGRYFRTAPSDVRVLQEARYGSKTARMRDA